MQYLTTVQVILHVWRKLSPAYHRSMSINNRTDFTNYLRTLLLITFFIPVLHIRLLCVNKNFLLTYLLNVCAVQWPSFPLYYWMTWDLELGVAWWRHGVWSKWRQAILLCRCRRFDHTPTSSSHAHLDRHHYEMTCREPASNVAENLRRFLVLSVQARGMTLNWLQR